MDLRPTPSSKGRPGCPAEEGLPLGRQRFLEPDNDTPYYYNRVTRSTTWDKPGPAQEGLPPGWECFLDCNTDWPYYYNHVTRDTTWDKPGPAQEGLPPGWECFLDCNTDWPYYYNRVTRDTTWDKPGPAQEGLPPGWECFLDSNTDWPYYYNRVTWVSTWEKPQTNPPPNFKVDLRHAPRGKRQSGLKKPKGNLTGLDACAPMGSVATAQHMLRGETSQRAIVTCARPGCGRRAFKGEPGNFCGRSCKEAGPPDEPCSRAPDPLPYADDGLPFIAWHGTSYANAVAIREGGFWPSLGGNLGPGIYFAGERKAARFAHDLHNAAPALLKCSIVVERPKYVADDDDNWQAEGHDSCRAEYTSLSPCPEWCILCPSQIRVLKVVRLANRPRPAP